jgi:NAD(P)-dependent dehydrogenase (short-subunit alcohol dehydrogenase family)/regulator of replication initiation timing
MSISVEPPASWNEAAMPVDLFNEMGDAATPAPKDVYAEMTILDREWYFPRRLVVKLLGCAGSEVLEAASEGEATVDIENETTGAGPPSKIGLTAAMDEEIFALVVEGDSDVISFVVDCKGRAVGTARLTSEWIKESGGSKNQFWKGLESEAALEIKSDDGAVVGTLRIQTHWEDEGAFKRETGRQIFRVSRRLENSDSSLRQFPWVGAKSIGDGPSVGEILVADEKVIQPFDGKAGAVWVRLSASVDPQGREGWLCTHAEPTSSSSSSSSSSGGGDKVWFVDPAFATLEHQARRWTEASAALALQVHATRRKNRLRARLFHTIAGVWPATFAASRLERLVKDDSFLVRSDRRLKPTSVWPEQDKEFDMLDGRDKVAGSELCSYSEAKLGADKGDPQKIFEYGMHVEMGNPFVRPDASKAFALYVTAAEAGYGPASVTVGYCYAYGLGVDKDDKAACEWYAKAAELGENGSAQAQNNLGFMHEAGRQPPNFLGLFGAGGPNIDKAIEFYEKAAAQNNAMAISSLVRLGKKELQPVVQKWSPKLKRYVSDELAGSAPRWEVPVYDGYVEDGKHPVEALSVDGRVRDHFLEECWLKWRWQCAMKELFSPKEEFGMELLQLATKIQRWYIGIVNGDKAYLATAKGAVVKMQAWWHERVYSYKYRLSRISASKIQAVWRRVTWLIHIAHWRTAGALLTRWWRGTYWRKYGFHGRRSPIGARGPLFKNPFESEGPSVISDLSRVLAKKPLLLGSSSMLSRCAVRVQTLHRTRSIWKIFKDIASSVITLQKVWRGYLYRCWFAEMMQMEVYPVITAWEYKIGLWNRLIQRVHTNFRIKSNVTVIMGSVSDNVTQLLCKKFILDAFSCVVVCDGRPQAEGNAVVEQLALSGPGSVYYCEGNTSDATCVVELVDVIKAQTGKIDFLVNNSAAQGRDEEAKTDEVAWLDTTDILGPVAAFKAVLPALQESGGVIVNISPYEAQGAAPSLKMAAIKAGFLAFSAEAAAAYPDVRINTICPLVSITGPSGGRKPINPGVADLANYLTSIDGPFMSGQVFNVQGYMTEEQWGEFVKVGSISIPERHSLHFSKKYFLEDNINDLTKGYADEMKYEYKKSVRQQPRVLKEMKEENARLQAENARLKAEAEEAKQEAEEAKKTKRKKKPKTEEDSTAAKKTGSVKKKKKKEKTGSAESP